MNQFFVVLLTFAFTGSRLLAETAEEASHEILGEVPEGWEVVEIADGPVTEKWVVLENGEKRKILLRPFSLRPIRGEKAKFVVKNPLETSAGQNLSLVVEAQNENLVESQDELTVMLRRLRQLLRTLPDRAEP